MGTLPNDQQFIYRTAVLAVAGFLASGCFDYTYGHSLGLILIAFATLTPLVPETVPR